MQHHRSLLTKVHLESCNAVMEHILQKRHKGLKHPNYIFREGPGIWEFKLLVGHLKIGLSIWTLKRKVFVCGGCKEQIYFMNLIKILIFCWKTVLRINFWPVLLWNISPRDTVEARSHKDFKFRLNKGLVCVQQRAICCPGQEELIMYFSGWPLGFQGTLLWTLHALSLDSLDFVIQDCLTIVEQNSSLGLIFLTSLPANSKKQYNKGVKTWQKIYHKMYFSWSA